MEVRVRGWRLDIEVRVGVRVRAHRRRRRRRGERRDGVLQQRALGAWLGLGSGSGLGLVLQQRAVRAVGAQLGEAREALRLEPLGTLLRVRGRVRDRVRVSTI